MSPVKPKRPYDSAGAEHRPAKPAKRSSTPPAAVPDDGFATTTIAAIAAGAGVSVDTIYKTFGGKPGLVRAICQQALAGEQPVPAETRSDALQATEPDPREDHPWLGRLATEIAPG